MYEVVTDPVLPQPVSALTLLTAAVVSFALTPAARLTNRTDLLLYLQIDVLNIVIFLAFSARPTIFVTVNFYDRARSFHNSNLQNLHGLVIQNSKVKLQKTWCSHFIK